MMQRKNTIVQNLNIRYYQSENINKNNVLVFLHGWGSEALHFRKTLEKCESFVAVDLPGFGNSELPETNWSLSEYISFLKDFLSKLDIKDPIIAGHSFGGSIAIKYCAQSNEAKKLILIGSSGIRRKTAKKHFFFVIAKISKVIFLIPGLSSAREYFRKRFYKAIDAEDYISAGALTEIYRKIISEDLKEDLKKINIPTILIWGENDKDTPLQEGRLMQQLIKNSELFIISNAGHYVFLDNKKDFDETFLSYIK